MQTRSDWDSQCRRIHIVVQLSPWPHVIPKKQLRQLQLRCWVQPSLTSWASLAVQHLRLRHVPAMRITEPAGSDRCFAEREQLLEEQRREAARSHAQRQREQFERFVAAFPTLSLTNVALTRAGSRAPQRSVPAESLRCSIDYLDFRLPLGAVTLPLESP